MCRTVLLTTAVEELIELRAALFIEINNFATEHQTPHPQFRREEVTQHQKTLGPIRVAREQACCPVVDICEGAEAVVLDFKTNQDG